MLQAAQAATPKPETTEPLPTTSQTAAAAAQAAQVRCSGSDSGSRAARSRVVGGRRGGALPI